MKRQYVQEAISSNDILPTVVQAYLGVLEPICLIYPSGKHTFLHTKIYFKVMYLSNIDVAHFKHLK